MQERSIWMNEMNKILRTLKLRNKQKATMQLKIDLIVIQYKQTIKLQIHFHKINLSQTDLQTNIMQFSSNRKDLRIQINDSIDKTFKEYAKTISESIQKLNSFTQNLQGKVNNLLKAQQTQFVTSYKSHMSNIKEELGQMEKKMLQYQNKIQYYENQGRLSNYIKKVNFLELQQLKLFQQISAKDKKIKDLQFEVQMFKKLQKDSDQKIKTMFRKKIQEQEQKQRQTQNELKSTLIKQNSQSNLETSLGTNKHMSSIQTFATQIPSLNYNRRLKLKKSHSKERQVTNMIFQDGQKSLLYKSHDYGATIQVEQNSVANENDLKNFKISTLQKQVSQLKAQNKKLLLFNSKYASNLSQLGEFFIKTVQELKKNIAFKRKIKSDITFSDFSKQDKLILIATLLSNEQAIMLLYDCIFKPHPNKKRAQSVLQKSYGSVPISNQKKIQDIVANPQHNYQNIAKSVFPSIKSKRLFY